MHGIEEIARQNKELAEDPQLARTVEDLGSSNPAVVEEAIKGFAPAAE